MKLGTGREIERKDGDGNVRAFDQRTATPRVPLATTTYLEEEINAGDLLDEAKRILKERPPKT